MLIIVTEEGPNHENYRMHQTNKSSKQQQTNSLPFRFQAY